MKLYRKSAINHFLFILSLFLLNACGANPGAESAANLNKIDSKQEDDAFRTPVCTVDRFKQPNAPVSKKLDVLFVMDNSNSMNRHWQLMATKIDRLLSEFPKGQDIRIAVVLGTIEKYPGVLFSAPKQPKVLDATKLTAPQIMNSLRATFNQALLRENIDWTGAGEALFFSLYYAATTQSQAIQKQGFFRPDAGLDVIFMSDDAEESYPYPSRQIWGLPNKCNWAHHERIRKTFYLPRKIDTDTTFAALRRLKGDMPLVTNAFVNITKEDILVDNSLDAHCIFDSAGFGYFDMVKRSGGVLWSIHRDRGLGLQEVGRMAKSRLSLVHDFRISKSADKVDPASIRAEVDGAQVEHTYKVDTNVVHLENAGKPGSSVEITHCEPVPQHNWTIAGFSGVASQSTAELGWKTAEFPTSGYVRYGTDPDSLNDTLADDAVAHDHAVTVTGLAPNTTYYFQAVATDEFETEKRSEVISLRTRPVWTVGALTGSVSRHTAALLWQTPEYATFGRVVYGTSPEQLLGASAETAQVTNHQVSVEGLSANTLYYFQAISRDQFGLEQRSNMIALRTVQDWAIVALTGSAGRFEASLTWATPEYPTESGIRYGLSPDAIIGVERDPAVGTQHFVSITGLAPNTTYYFQAFARDNLGSVKESEVITLRTVADWTLGAVTSTSTENTFSVAFATSGFPTTGKVLWGLSQTQMNNEADAGAEMAEHNATIQGLTPNTLYYYQAVAYDYLGQRRLSPVASVRTKAVEVPLPQWQITGLEGAATIDKVSLLWKTSAYPTKGFVRFGTSPTSLTQRVDESAAAQEHSLEVAGLAPNTLYYFQVVATDDRGQTQESSVIAVRTQVKEEPLPDWEISGFAGSANSRSIEARWFTDTYATRGKVRYGTNGNSLDQETPWEESSSKVHAFMINSLAADTTYYLQAVSMDDRGQTKVSAVIEVKTLSVPLPNWQISGFDGTTTSTQANLIWQTPLRATKAVIQVGLTADDFSFRSVDVPSYSTTHVAAVVGLAPNTAYFFRIVAEDEDGGKVMSNTISKKTKP